MSATRTASAERRRGFTLVEITASVVMLAAAMTLTVQLLGALAAERRAAERRLCAVQEVANLMERVAARPWAEVTPESLRTVSLSPRALQALPGAELTATVDDASAGPGGKRISLRLRWRDRAGTWTAPVRLSAWIYRLGGDR
jgi:type II secretory pathway pseudopilin PulG